MPKLSIARVLNASGAGAGICQFVTRSALRRELEVHRDPTCQPRSLFALELQPVELHDERMTRGVGWLDLARLVLYFMRYDESVGEFQPRMQHLVNAELSNGAQRR